MIARPGLAPPQPTGAEAPASWWEWYFRKYPLDKWVPKITMVGATINVPANNTNQAPINVRIPIFAYAFVSRAFVAADGSALTIPYRIGFAYDAGSDFTNGEWLASLVTGDATGAANPLQNQFPLPLEISPQSAITITVLNTCVAASPDIVVDAAFWGWEPRKRTEFLQGR